MSRAIEQSSTHIWAAEALELLAAAYGSIPTAERVLRREAKAGQIPWTAKDVDPPGAPIDKLWQHHGYTLETRLAQNEASFLSIDLGPVKVGGIKFERAAIMALLPTNTDTPIAEPAVNAPIVDAPPSKDPVATIVFDLAAKHPRGLKENMRGPKGWAQKMIQTDPRLANADEDTIANRWYDWNKTLKR